MSKRNRSRIGRADGIATSFKVKEEEQFVANDSTAKATAELGTLEVRFRRYKATDLGQSLLNRRIGCQITPSAVIEKGVCCERVVAVINTERSVKIVRTTAGDQLDLTAAASTFRGARVGGYCTKLLDRIDRGIADSRESLARGLVIRIDSVDRDVALIGTSTGNGSHAVGGSGTDVVSDNAWLQTDKGCGRIADLDGQFTKLTS